MNEIDYRQLRYLLIDDEPFVLKMSVRILGKLECEHVVTAGNGRDALAALHAATTAFDIIICDLNMPEMDGIEFMRNAAESEFAGGVIYLSGEDERMLETAYELARAYNLNILGVIQKPLQPDTLISMLEKFQPVARRKQFVPQESITEKELLAGLEGDELLLVYQPKVSIASGKITGVETLARWNHKDRGVLGPGAFIPLAENSGLIDKLTEAVYRKAIRQTGEWLSRGIEIRNSVNFSINSFVHPGFANLIVSATDKEGIDPTHLVLEVTETQIMEDMVNCIEIMMRLRMKKFSLSIDDFGTGHSSMQQLKSIPFTELKIDRAFVHGANRNSSARAILESSIALAKKLKMEIVAEGAETREDWDLVEELGCDYVQGFYCAKPMTGEDLTALLENWSGPHTGA